MDANSSRLAQLAMRELLLVGIAGLAAALFIHHGVLYLTGDVTPRSARPEAYIVTTIVLYAFVRGIDLVLKIRPPRIRADLVLCPECGQEIGDPTPKGGSSHLPALPSRPPTERDVHAAAALRRAIDQAREAARARGRTVDPVVAALRGDFENAPAALVHEPEHVNSGQDLPRIPRQPWRPKLGR